MSAVFHISKQKNFVNYVHVNICIKLCYRLAYTSPEKTINIYAK